MPRALIVVWALLIVPVLFCLVVVGGSAVAHASSSAGPAALRSALRLGAALLAAVAGTAAARHARAPAARSVLTVAVALLLLAVAAPMVLSLFAAGTEEWCEGQPGGRGGAPITSEADVPLLCR